MRLTSRWDRVGTNTLILYFVTRDVSILPLPLVSNVRLQQVFFSTPWITVTLSIRFLFPYIGGMEWRFGSGM